MSAHLRPHRGRLILTLGVLSFVIAGVLTGIPAWVMGSGDLKKMDAGIMDPRGPRPHHGWTNSWDGLHHPDYRRSRDSPRRDRVSCDHGREIATDFQILRVGVINFTANNFIL